MKIQIKKLIILAILFASIENFAKVKSIVQISSKIEQANMPISKTFSLRLKDIRTIRLKSSNLVKLIDLYYEDSLGERIFLKIDKQISLKQPIIWNIKKSNLKKITYTVMAKLKNKSPVTLDLELFKAHLNISSTNQPIKKEE